MTKSMLGKSLAGLLMAGVVSFSLVACAEDEHDPTTPPPRKDLLPFSIGFDLSGHPVLLDEKGKPIPPSQVEFPIKATAIESVESITLVQYRGSHVKLIKIGGNVYSVPMPH